MSPDTAELVELYAKERPGMSKHVIAAFIEAGQEPPGSEHVKRLGFDAKERGIIGSYMSKHDPYGMRADLPAEA